MYSRFINDKFDFLWLGTILLFAIAYMPAFKILAERWAESEEYSHAFLVVPIILYMVYQKKNLLPKSSNLSTVPWTFPIIIFCSLYFFSLLTEVHSVIFISMFISALFSIAYIYGISSIKLLFTPILLFLMIIPVPDQVIISITFPLQLLVSIISEIVIRFFDIAVIRNGNIIEITNKKFEIVEACSGLRSVITLITMSVIIGYFFLKNNFLKVYLLLAAVFVAIIVNIFRIVSMVIFFEYLKFDMSKDPVHSFLGIFVIIIAFMLLFSIKTVMEKWEKIEK